MKRTSVRFNSWKKDLPEDADLDLIRSGTPLTWDTSLSETGDVDSLIVIA